MLRFRPDAVVPEPLLEQVDRAMVLAYRAGPVLKPATAAVVEAIRAAVAEDVGDLDGAARGAH